MLLFSSKSIHLHYLLHVLKLLKTYRDTYHERFSLKFAIFQRSWIGTPFLKGTSL